MKSVKPIPYVPAELEIIKLECQDIMTTSGGSSDGYVSDENVDNKW